jgi:hypothetical protein
VDQAASVAHMFALIQGFVLEEERDAEDKRFVCSGRLPDGRQQWCKPLS